MEILYAVKDSNVQWKMVQWQWKLTLVSFCRSADVLSGRHIVRCFLDILSGPSSDILSGLLGSAPDVLSGRLRIRHIVRRTFCQDWMDLHQTNCQDVYVDQSIFLVYWPYFWYVYDQISQFQPNFTILTKFYNFNPNLINLNLNEKVGQVKRLAE